MATGDVVSPMIGGSAARRPEEIERAAPDGKARRDLLTAVAEVAARRGFGPCKAIWVVNTIPSRV